jgi:hypothetical protein
MAHWIGAYVTQATASVQGARNISGKAEMACRHWTDYWAEMDKKQFEKHGWTRLSIRRGRCVNSVLPIV